MRRPGAAGGARPARIKVRRDVNLTVVIVVVLVCGTALALAWVGAAAVLAWQGLDTRGMLRVQLGPSQWAIAGGFATGLSAFLAVLKRMGRNERLMGRDVPEAIARAEQARRDAEAAEHAATRAEVTALRATLQAVAGGLSANLAAVVAHPDPEPVATAPVLSVVPTPRADPDPDEPAAPVVVEPELPVRSLAGVPTLTPTGRVNLAPAPARGRRAARPTPQPEQQLVVDELEVPVEPAPAVRPPAGYRPPPSWQEITGLDDPDR